MIRHPATSAFGWRLSLSETGLGLASLANYGLPAPQIADVRDHSALTSRGDGGQARHGYRSAELLFERLSEPQASVLMQMIRDARSGTGVLYMTLWVGAGYDGRPRWIDVRGYPHEPESLTANRYVGVNGQVAYDAARLVLRNFTVLNDPSSYTD